MRVLINPKHFDKKRFQTMIDHFPELSFTDDINDQSIEIMITWASAVKKEVLEKYPNLKLILLPSAGYDKADITYVKARGMILTNARGVYDIQIAEDVLAKILYFNRDMHRYQQNMHQRKWEPARNFYELYDKTVGIIGAGSIGQRIAKLLKGFDAHMIGYRRKDNDLPMFDKIYTTKKGFYTLLKESDYIILAVPLTSKTKYMIDKEAFSMMKKDALLINIARGEVIDQSALVEALNHGDIRGAALDVTTPEPLPDNDPLWQAKNVFISPHIAGTSPLSNQRVNALLKEIIKAYINHEPLTNRIT